MILKGMISKSIYRSLLTGVFSLQLLSGVVLADSLMIRNADLYTASGVKQKTDLLVVDNKITAVGKALEAPSGIREIDGNGKTVTAGLFNAATHIGVEEVSQISTTVDYVSENQRVTASLKVADAYNPNSMVIPQNRIHGLTRALVLPDSYTGLFSGQAALVHLGNDSEPVIDDSVAVVVSLGEQGQEVAGGSRAAAMAMLREALNDALDYASHKTEVEAGNRRDYALSLGDLQALESVVTGQKPLIVRVNRAADIRQVLSLAEQYSLKLILLGALEAWQLADELAQAKVPVIMDPVHNLPVAYETLGSRLDGALILHNAGVPLLFTGMGWQNTHNAYSVRQAAGNAVANGLPKDVAIAAMTTNPAKVFGLNSYGDLAPGQDADLVLWSGDPLEVMTEAELVLIKGEVIPMVSRSTRLRDRYFERIKQSMQAQQ